MEHHENKITNINDLNFRIVQACKAFEYLLKEEEGVTFDHAIVFRSPSAKFRGMTQVTFNCKDPLVALDKDALSILVNHDRFITMEFLFLDNKILLNFR